MNLSSCSPSPMHHHDPPTVASAACVLARYHAYDICRYLGLVLRGRANLLQQDIEMRIAVRSVEASGIVDENHVALYRMFENRAQFGGNRSARRRRRP